MSFLWKYINKIPHQSALQLRTRSFEKELVDLPEEARSIIDNVQLHWGDCIEFVGAPGTGKSPRMIKLAQLVASDSSQVVFVDFDCRIHLQPFENQYLYQPQDEAERYGVILGLRRWLSENTDSVVGWVFVDGWLDQELKKELVSCQATWGFILVTSRQHTQIGSRVSTDSSVSTVRRHNQRNQCHSIVCLQMA
ncbi:hypothetical protein F4703DRAFT_1868305 [Phycomyces blakesleeanus]